MPRSSDPRRTAMALVSTVMLAGVLVLGLWQQVDASCDTEMSDPDQPLAACAPEPRTEQPDAPRVPADAVDVRTIPS